MSGPASQARFLLSPAPGIYIMVYRRRILILSRIRHDHQNGGSVICHESIRLQSDESLRALIDDLPVATLLLIEDVDCVFKDSRSTTGDTGVTLSGLLNALDGVSSREGPSLNSSFFPPARHRRCLPIVRYSGNTCPDIGGRLQTEIYLIIMH
jgi:hypothetical protein